VCPFVFGSRLGGLEARGLLYVFAKVLEDKSTSTGHLYEPAPIMLLPRDEELQRHDSLLIEPLHCE
jgi:hypothetical protein